MEASSALPEQPRIEFFVVADWAESVNGKLYLMGGGFDSFFAQEFPFAHRFSFAAVFRVPWADTNRRFPVVGVLETLDGNELGWKMEGEAEAGRPAGVRAGQDVSMTIAGPVQFQVEEPTAFMLKLTFAGDERSIPLRVMEAPFQMRPPRR